MPAVVAPSTYREPRESNSEDYNRIFEQTAEQQWFKTDAARLLATLRPRLPIPSSCAVPLGEQWNDEASLSSEPIHVEYSAMTKANDERTEGTGANPPPFQYAEVVYSRFSRLALRVFEKHRKSVSSNSEKQKTELQNKRSNSSTDEGIPSSYLTVSSENVALEESQAMTSA